MSTAFEYLHVLTETEVCERATERLDHFVKHGGEPAGLDYRDFVDEALEIRARTLADEARALHLDLDEPRWDLTEDGIAHVVLPFHRSVDPILFRVVAL